MPYSALLVRIADGMVVDVHRRPTDAGDVPVDRWTGPPPGYEYRDASTVAPGVGCGWQQQADGSWSAPASTPAAGPPSGVSVSIELPGVGSVGVKLK